MQYYKIEIKGYALCPDCNNAKDLFQLRKAHLSITDIFWLIRDVEIDPYYIDCTYHYHTPVLIFLN